MRRQIDVLLLLISTVFQSHAQTAKPMLKDGVITYLASSGGRTKIRIDKPCADLWVSPDERVIAFITLDKTNPAEIGMGQLEESNIHIAKKSDNFKSILIALKPIHIRGMQWKVVRQPSISPDLKTLYFLVPSYLFSF
jgi:hypothetical protein